MTANEKTSSASKIYYTRQDFQCCISATSELLNQYKSSTIQF